MEAIREGETIHDEYWFWDLPYSYQEARDYATTIEQEAVLRYPQDSTRNHAYWSLVYRDAVEDFGAYWDTVSIPVTSLVSWVQEALDSGQTQPNSLDEWLRSQQHSIWQDSCDLRIDERYTVTGLLGDGQTADVLLVGAGCEGHSVNTALVALVGSGSGNHRMVPIRDQWGRLDPGFLRSETIIAIGDHNGNGLPEIASVISWGAHAGCGSHIEVYEWQDDGTGGHFVDVALEIDPISAHVWFDPFGTCDGHWAFGLADSDGRQSIIKTDVYSNLAARGCASYQVRTSYDWVGHQYVQAVQEVTPYPSDQPARCAVGWANTAAAQGRYDLAIPLLATTLKDWPVRAREEWGPSAEDYWRFRLGVWYALQGQVELAQTTLRSVRDEPVNPDFDAAAQFADAYLSRYQDNQDPYVACMAVVDRASSSLSGIEFPAPVDVPQTLQEVWGFGEPNWVESSMGSFGWPTHVLCDLYAAETISQQMFRQSIRTLEPANQDALWQWFGEQEIPIWTIEQADLVGNGAEDWLVFGSERVGTLPGVWAIVHGGDGLLAEQISSSGVLTGSSSIALRHWRLAEDNSYVNALQIDHELVIFSILPQATTIQVQELLHSYQVEDYEVKLSGGRTELVVRDVDGELESYVWDPDEQIPSLVRSSGIERRIKTAQALSAAISMDQAFFPTGDMTRVLELAQTMRQENLLEGTWYEDKEPYVCYLLGLAYELTGDRENAVKAYWQLWKDYPESPYVLIVRRKLVPVD